MVLFWFDQQERLKTKKGEELLSSDRRGEIAPTNVAPAPEPVEGKIVVKLDAGGKPVVVVRDTPRDR